jgi:tetratricopeptide (TPR) repeat protein
MLPIFGRPGELLALLPFSPRSAAPSLYWYYYHEKFNCITQNSLVSPGGNMRLQPYIAVIVLFFTSTALAQVPAAPLTRVEILGLHIAGVTNENLELMVRQRGITFQPDSDFLDVLQRTGAGEVLIARLRTTEPISTNSKAAVDIKDSAVSPALSACGSSFAAGDLPSAERACRAAMEGDVKNPVLSLALSNVLAARQHYDEAVALAYQAVPLGPQLSATHVVLGRDLSKIGRVDAAAAEFREALRLNADDIDARLDLDQLFGDKKNDTGSGQESTQVAKLQPASSAAHEASARVAMVRRDWDTGVDEWRAYLRQVPESIDGHVQLGICLVKLAERLGAEAQDATQALSEAIDNLRQAVQVNPKQAEAHFWLTHAYTQLGNYAAARQEMQTTLNLEPDNPVYAKAYTQLAHSWSTSPLPEVPEDVQKTLLVHKVDPVYPTLAERTGVRGTVHCRVVVAMNGTVKQLQVISGPPVLVKSALDAARQYVYQTTMLYGVPVEVETTISIAFPPTGTQSRSTATR